MADMRRQVGAALEVQIAAPTTLEFQIAVAPHPGTAVFEALSFMFNGSAVSAAEITRKAAMWSRSSFNRSA